MTQVTDSDHLNTAPGAGGSEALRRGRPDIQTMRTLVAALLGPDEPLPRFDELADRTDQLCGHLRNLIPAVEGAALALPARDPRRTAALDAVADARGRLNASPGPGLVSATQHARSLARELRTLCHHHDTLAQAAPSRGRKSNSTLISPQKPAFTGLPGRLTLESAQSSVSTARDFARACVGHHLADSSEELLDDVCLVVSELVTNSVRYGTEPGDKVLLVIQPTPKHVRIEVHDPVRRRPRMRGSTGVRVRGRGLHIVEALAEEWGVFDRPFGKAVWAEVAR